MVLTTWGEVQAVRSQDGRQVLHRLDGLLLDGGADGFVGDGVVWCLARGEEEPVGADGL